MVMWEYQNSRIFLQRLALKIRSCVYVLEIFNGGKIVGTFLWKRIAKDKAKRTEKSNKGKTWQSVC